MRGKSGIAEQLKTSMFNEWDDFVLGEIGTEKVGQMLRSSVVVQTYGLKGKRIFHMFLRLFCDN